jgi:hypothetical protein
LADCCCPWPSSRLFSHFQECLDFFFSVCLCSCASKKTPLQCNLVSHHSFHGPSSGWPIFHSVPLWTSSRLATCSQKERSTKTRRLIQHQRPARECLSLFLPVPVRVFASLGQWQRLAKRRFPVRSLLVRRMLDRLTRAPPRIVFTVHDPSEMMPC